jgi:long-subunit acyl-CoA synthetase (AMP-forming)
VKPALHDGRRAWSASELDVEVDAAVALLRGAGVRTLATLLDNGPAFVALDEAAARAGVVHVPLPLFFTPEQLAHALRSAGVDALMVDAALGSRWPGLEWRPATMGGRALQVARLQPLPVALPPGTARITFTSGTTDAPKGVCLSRAAMATVAGGVAQALAPLAIERHLNALPHAVLLEDIAGVQAPRLQGATIVSLPLHEVGLTGSSSFDPARLDAAVRAHDAHSVILLPQMLRAWCAWLVQGGRRAPASLRFVAVGGAAVGAPLIEAAQALHLPVGEGYGLSEGASVQTLNLPGQALAGSVGRPLPHARLRVAADGEIEIAGSLFAGYLGDPAPVPAWWPTGDLGRIDDDGFVHVMGRKKNLLITAYGRNVSPEWVETALRSQPVVAQAVVFGDGEPELGAVLWPTRADVGDRALQAAVDAANDTLPDYARVAHWVRGRGAFDASAGFATANGRPQRAAIWRAHAEAFATPAAPVTSNA